MNRFSFYIHNCIQVVFLSDSDFHFLSLGSVFIRCILIVCRYLWRLCFQKYYRMSCTCDRDQYRCFTRTQCHLYSRRSLKISFWHPVDQAFRGSRITSWKVATSSLLCDDVIRFFPKISCSFLILSNSSILIIKNHITWTESSKISSVVSSIQESQSSRIKLVPIGSRYRATTSSSVFMTRLWTQLPFQSHNVVFIDLIVNVIRFEISFIDLLVFHVNPSE